MEYAEPMSLRELPTTLHFVTSTDGLLENFYIPALKRSIYYDRGVGYFTSSWLRLAASGLAGLASNGGKARIIASPMLDRDDCAAICQGIDASNNSKLNTVLANTFHDLEYELSYDTLAAIAWMVADELLEFRVALPTATLDGDFHDKFGVFCDATGNAIAFHGSPNDSERAFRNYESISVFYSWMDEREALRVQNEQERFELIWNNRDFNLRVYALPDAIRRNLIAFTSRVPRPYPQPSSRDAIEVDRWRHQKEAIAIFLKLRNGILEMATGTGKTRTALQILEELRERGLVDTTIIVAFGTDLLDQWHKEILQYTSLPIHRFYERHREAQSFINAPKNAILLTSRQNLSQVLSRLKSGVLDKSLIICDEVHGLGSAALVTSLAGRLKPIKYRLGLSATPERVYDAEGSRFIENEIGPVIFQFGLKEAIERGILCEFDYVQLKYELSDNDRIAIRQAIKRHHAKTNAGESQPIEALYRAIAYIRKVTIEKIGPFRDYVTQNAEALQRCIIFVETADFGALVQPILMNLRIDFHTYYQDDDRENLQRFANGDIQCLLTCHRISEGIDIRSVNNIVLFASARARLETVQRLGRCLRADPNNNAKRARVIDFIQPSPTDADDPSGELSADEERRDWFLELAYLKKTYATETTENRKGTS